MNYEKRTAHTSSVMGVIEAWHQVVQTHTGHVSIVNLSKMEMEQRVCTSAKTVCMDKYLGIEVRAEYNF